MPSRRSSLRPSEDKEIPVSILGIESREEMLWIAKDALPVERFPPCISNIIQRTGDERGGHRIAAILAAFLGQAGWEESRAKDLWSDVSHVEERIFTEWFKEMNCPKCETIKRKSGGYPDLGIADLDFCRPDKRCLEFDGPIECAFELKDEMDLSKGSKKHIKTINIVRVLDWSSGKERKIELSEAERAELGGLLKEQKEDETLVYTRTRVRGRLRPKFLLRRSEEPRRRILSELM